MSGRHASLSSRALSALDPARVLVLGDTHGSAGFVEHAVAAARRLGCNAVLQLGDFGFWAHTDDGVRFLASVSRALDDDLPLLFVDGNHENHDLLTRIATNCVVNEHVNDSASNTESNAAGNDPDPAAVCVAPHVFWLRRGTRWSWHGVRFAALGGAASVDRPRRTPGTSWWDTEVLTPADVERLGLDPLDVLVTHDNPSAAAFEGWYPVTDHDQRRCDASRALLDSAVAATTPRLVLHGHWHERRSWDATHTDGSPWRIESFAHDGARFADAAAVLTLPGLTLEPLR